MPSEKLVPSHLVAKEYQARVFLARAVRDSEAISDMLIWNIEDAIDESDLFIASERARNSAITSMRHYLETIAEVEAFKEGKPYIKGLT